MKIRDNLWELMKKESQERTESPKEYDKPVEISDRETLTEKPVKPPEQPTKEPPSWKNPSLF